MLLQIDSQVVALGLGTVLALGASAIVLVPLVNATESAPMPTPEALPVARDPQASAVEALREIEFDRATGKLADADYVALKAQYTKLALAELREQDRAVAAPAGALGAVAVPAVTSDDAVESALRAFRARALHCPEHGVRPQADARFCSDCGRYLAARCPGCGAACDRDGQRFCTDCGTALAAA